MTKQTKVETAVEKTSGIETATEQKVVETAGAKKSPDLENSEGGVLVKPLTSYVDAELKEWVTPDSKPYKVSEVRARHLAASGNAEYANNGDIPRGMEDHIEAVKARRAIQNEAPHKPVPFVSQPLVATFTTKTNDK